MKRRRTTNGLCTENWALLWAQGFHPSWLSRNTLNRDRSCLPTCLALQICKWWKTDVRARDKTETETWSEERSQGDGDVGFCSAREETDAGSKDAEWMKIERERKKGKLVSSLGGGFSCNVIRVRLTVDYSIYRWWLGSVRLPVSVVKLKPNRQDFMVLKIGLIGFPSRFGFLD